MADDQVNTGKTAGPENTPLGKKIAYVDTYCPELLCPVTRADARQVIFEHTRDPLPFSGVDIWTAYELSWLDSNGKPQVAMAEFRVPADSPNIIESKSLKYYLNSLNQSEFESWKALSQTLADDLSRVAGADVVVELYSLNLEAVLTSHIPGQCVDGLDLDNPTYEPDPSLLQVNTRHTVVSEAVYSHLLKTNCPVTGQPDWATVWVQYSGPAIDPASFLAYVVSYRKHQGFHESCVEKIFRDLQRVCKAEELTVYARYTRRGGLDINPFRTSTKLPAPVWRLLRQ